MTDLRTYLDQECAKLKRLVGRLDEVVGSLQDFLADFEGWDDESVKTFKALEAQPTYVATMQQVFEKGDGKECREAIECAVALAEALAWELERKYLT